MTHCYGILAEGTPLQDWEKEDTSQSTSADRELREHFFIFFFQIIIILKRIFFFHLKCQTASEFFHTKNRNFFLFSEI